MILKLKQNPYTPFSSPYPYKWLEVVAITPSKMKLMEIEAGNETKEFLVETNWICRSDQGIVQLSGVTIEKALALEIYVDSSSPDKSLRTNEKLRLQSTTERVSTTGS